MIRRVGAWVEKPRWRMRPARRNWSATSQQPPARSVISTQLGEFSPWNDSRSMVSTPSKRERLLELAWRTRRDSRRDAAWSAARRRCAGGAPAPCPTADLAGAVAARGLEVVDADARSRGDDRLDVGLAGGADPRAPHPALLRAHAAAREHRHVDLGSSETPVEHGRCLAQFGDEVGVRRRDDLGRVHQRGVEHADRRVDGGLDLAERARHGEERLAADAARELHLA